MQEEEKQQVSKEPDNFLRSFVGGFGFRPRSLAFRLTVLSLTILICIAVIVYSFLLVPIRLSLDRAEQIRHWDFAEVVARRLQPFVDPQIDYEEVQRTISDFAQLSPETLVLILDQDGRVRIGLDDGTSASPINVDLGPINKFLSSKPDDTDTIYAPDPAQPYENRILSAARLRVAGRNGYVIALKSSWKNNIFIQGAYKHGKPPVLFKLILALFALAAIAGYAYLIIMGWRFRKVVRVAAEIAGGSYESRINDRRRDEISLISNALDSMAENLVRNIRELERKDDLRRRLIADVSHDLRGPVASMRAVIETLADRFERTSAEQRNVFIGGISRNINALGALVGALFELARIEARETPMQIEPIPVGEFALGIRSRFAPAAAAAGVELAVELDDSGTCAEADGEMLERIVSNLVENALQHTPPGGAVRIEIATADDEVIFSIRDSGSGIAEEHLPRVFERFFTRPGSSSSGSGTPASPHASAGTGLGLSIVQRLIEAHGSRISVQSAPGVGTVFSFRLRRSHPPQHHSSRTD